MCLRRKLELWSPSNDLCCLFSRRRINDRGLHKEMTPAEGGHPQQLEQRRKPVGQQKPYRPKLWKQDPHQVGALPGNVPITPLKAILDEGHGLLKAVSLVSIGSFRVSILSHLIKMDFVHTWGSPSIFCLKCPYPQGNGTGTIVTLMELCSWCPGMGALSVTWYPISYLTFPCFMLPSLIYILHTLLYLR